MAVDLNGLLADLTAESAVVDGMIAGLAEAEWDRPTPAAGWAIRDQVSHLAHFDLAALTAATDPELFRAEAADLVALGDGFPDVVAARHRTMPPVALLDWWRENRRELVDTMGTLDPSARVPWFGPDMSVASSVTARLMETWAHGQDIADALGVRREPTVRLRHVAHLGVRTFGFAYRLRGLPVPDVPVRVELTAPDGSTWTWGPADAVDRVTGPALDFCLVVTQRRHRSDTALRIEGPVAGEWMGIAQAFAGAVGPGRPAEVAS